MGKIGFLLIMILLQFSSAAAPAEYYVSTDGNDLWSGRLPSPNLARTDGPFATLEKARDVIRTEKLTGRLMGGCTVALRGGTYFRDQSFDLTAKDSGSTDAPMIYEAYNEEVVRLVGGNLLKNWELSIDPQTLQRINPLASGKIFKVNLRALGIADYGAMKTAQGGAAGDQGLLPYSPGPELFFNDKPMMLARWPNQGFVSVGELLGNAPRESHGIKGDNIGIFSYDYENPRHWIGQEDIMLHGYWFWDWSDQRHKVASIDILKKVITLETPYHYYGYRKGQRYYAYNILPELDIPGEYWLDRGNGDLYFWPPASIETGTAVVSTLSTIIQLENTHNVVIQGIIFEVSKGTLAFIKNGMNNKFINCIFRNTASWALDINSGKNNGIQGCKIYETGDGGIILNGGDRKKLEPAMNFAINNHIFKYSRINRINKPAIAIYGVGQKVSHNLIHDAPHMAIQLSGNDHLIEYNEIHNVCYETGDAGAIYAGYDWTMRGNSIRYNYLHHINGPGMHGARGVYLDDMFSSANIYGNLFFKVDRAVFIGGGRDNVIENNVFADCSPAVRIDARGLGWARSSVMGELKKKLDAVPYREAPWSVRFPELVEILQDEPGAPKGNIIKNNVFSNKQWISVEAKAMPLTILQNNTVNKDFYSIEAETDRLRLNKNGQFGINVLQRIPLQEIGITDVRK